MRSQIRDYSTGQKQLAACIQLTIRKTIHSYDTENAKQFHSSVVYILLHIQDAHWVI